MKLPHQFAVATQAAFMAVFVAACAHTGGHTDDAEGPGIADSIVSQSLISMDGKDFIRLDIKGFRRAGRFDDTGHR